MESLNIKEKSLLRIAEALENFSGEKIGDLNDLDTQTKDNLVAAINELVDAQDDLAEKQDGLAEKQGDLADLTTTAKTSIVAAINELVTRVAALEAE